MVKRETAEDLRIEPEFSILVNRIPDGPLWPPTSPTLLWDIYGEVLFETLLAQPSRSPDEEAAYHRAIDLLYNEDDVGALTDSQVALAYRQLRDAWLLLSGEYANRAGAAELADPEPKRQWEEIDEPKLKAAMDDVQHRWAVEGGRADVEEAQRVVRFLGDRSPAATWGRFRSVFDLSTPEIVFKTDAESGLGRFVPTSFRPSDALEQPWYSISLSANQLAELASQAPPALRERLGDSMTTTVESLSFDYTSVGISRPWFFADAFSSRAWRFPDGSRVLSDGEDPPAGICPAYVAGLALARNIAATIKADPPETATDDSGVKIGPRFGFAHLGRPAVMVAQPSVAPAAHARSVSGTIRDHRATPLIATVSAPPSAAAPTATPVGAAVVRATVSTRLLEAVDFHRIDTKVDLTPVVPVTDQTSEGVASTPPESIYILAFICRRLPKSPDPDDNVAW